MPLSILLDDFEDGDPNPADTRFGIWQSFSYNPSGQAVDSWLEAPGDDSNISMHLEWVVEDTPDGLLDYPGAGLRTVASSGYVDLSRYTRMVLSHRHEPALDGCKPVTSFIVSMTCAEHDTSFRTSLAVSPEWVTATLPFSSLAEPSYLSPTGTALADCLAVVDTLNFQVQAELLDGECSSGTLLLDSISFR